MGWLQYIRWPDIDVGIHFHVNGCQREPMCSLDVHFRERIEAVKSACKLLEDTTKALVWPVDEFPVRVTVPPPNNCYLVKLVLEVQRLRKHNSSTRTPALKVRQMIDNGKKRKAAEPPTCAPM